MKHLCAGRIKEIHDVNLGIKIYENRTGVVRKPQPGETETVYGKDQPAHQPDLHHPSNRGCLFNQYIVEVILRHVKIIEDFINSLGTNFRGREAFVTRSLKYHYNCIIDSYTYALLVLQHKKGIGLYLIA